MKTRRWQHATPRGLFVHQMIGILPDKVREVYEIPMDVQPTTGLAIGYVADANVLPEPYRGRDLAARKRKGLSRFVFSGTWGSASPLVK